MNKMAKIAIPIVLIIFTMGVLQQQAFGMIYVNIGDQLGQANLAPVDHLDSGHRARHRVRDLRFSR